MPLLSPPDKNQKTQKIFHIADRADALIGRLFALLMYRGILVLVLLVVFVMGILSITPFERILREDAYVYVNKALEIVNRDFVPPRNNAVGWPLLLASLFALLQINDLFTAMFVARWVSIACVCASGWMIYVICKRLIKGKNKYQIAAAAAVCSFLSSPHLPDIAQDAMTEPLFIFFTLACIYFLVDDRTTVKSIVLSAVFAGLAYYVRPNGIFFIGTIIGVLLLRAVFDKTIQPKLFLIAVVVFFLVSAPHMVSRHQAYGSAFDYGENSKIFVDSYGQVWAPNIKAPTFLEYLKTHTLSDYFEKFIANGLWRVLTDLYNAMLPEFWAILLMASFFKYVLIRREKEYDAFYTWILISIMGLSLIYDVFGSTRHLVYLVPIIILASVGFLSSIDRDSQVKFSNIILLVVLLFSLGGLPWGWKIDIAHLRIPEIRDNWAVWAARNLDGNVVIIEGGDILESAQHYSEFTHQRKTILPFDQVQRKITSMRPGVYERLEDALPDFKQMGVKYVITDGSHIRRRPYLKEIQGEKWTGRFRHLKYFQRRPRGGVLYDVNIYKVCYDPKCS